MTYIAHYGVGHLNGGHSGRYPWGSGKDPKQTEADRKRIYEEKKEKAIKSGSAREVLKYRGDLTNEQLAYAANRIRWESELQKYDPYRVDNALKNIGDFGVKAAATVATYDVLASVYNVYARSKGKNELPTILRKQKG